MTAAPLTQRQIAALPAHPTLTLTATADGRASVGTTPVPVPAGTDPRVAAANAAINAARHIGRPVRAILHAPDGARWPMVITPDGQVLQRTEPLDEPPEGKGTPPPAPGQASDPRTVPPWPVLAITLAADGTATVDGVAVPRVPGCDPRATAIAAAARAAAARGLNRAVRATATDPDGTAWPLIIHPDGTATDAGPPTPAPHRRRSFRRRPAPDGATTHLRQEGR